MSEKYDHSKIERKWQKIWEKKGWKAVTGKGRKFYSLVEFPYPSGDGLHVGHIRSYTAMDVVARKRRAEGFNVLYPIGWDAFGLPAENYAVKTGIHPKITTKENTDTFRRQLKSLGISFDWSREINTTDPNYYKWTQWIFLQFFKKGLAYKAEMPINWCLSCKIGLANEEVVEGKCERCGGETEKRNKKQWMLAITKYAERLHKDLETLDYLPQIKTSQRNWIGRSEGANLKFKIYNSEFKGFKEKELAEVGVFTTRPDTLFGATYLVIAPEHPLIQELRSSIKNFIEVGAYVIISSRKSELERASESREKTGVRIQGITAINPANKEEIPIYVADYVLKGYGTGAIMAVPAHDERDFEFAKKFNLPIKMVVCPNYPDPTCPVLEKAYEGAGHMVDSGKFNGMDSEKAKKEIAEFVGGKEKISYKLRDWVFSRQRYWGEPIPIIDCGKCGYVAVPEKDLPLKLPDIKNYKPTDTGDSPLAGIPSWVNVKCPKCKGNAKRETDVMPNWAGSSWYYLRYTDPHNKKEFASKKSLKYFMPVDWYNGGMEHTTLHLLYSRFWHKFLYDLKLVPDKEPYKKRTSHGVVLANDGQKMSKSRGNAINPDEIVKNLGADTLRLYELFMGPFGEAIAWNPDSVAGCRRFLERVWRLKEKISKINLDPKTDTLIHKTIKKVSEDIEQMKFNTAVSSLMQLSNGLEELASVPLLAYRALLRLLAPLAPHMTEEIWSKLKEKKSVHETPWPKWDKKKTVDAITTLAVSINGKLRATISLPNNTPEERAVSAAKEIEALQKWLSGKNIRKVVYMPGKIINFVVE